MNVAIRKAASSQAVPANGWSDDLRWYAAGINQMKALSPGLDEYRPKALRANDLLNAPDLTAAEDAELRALVTDLEQIIKGWSDPRSLGYQAQVHATFMFTPARWPRHKGKKVLWRECAHGNWFFLPWHRAYLAEFESVVREHIKALGGPHETWALPYWNSSDYRSRPKAARLPKPLRDRVVPTAVDVPGLTAAGGQARPNPLFEPSRLGPSPLPATPSFIDWADASEALLREHYANADGSNFVSFAGGYLEDLSRFHSSREGGQVDRQPHGGGHVEVGGFMASFLTAGLDPVFWMHHANVDRLWETYADDLGHGYPFPDGRPAGGLAAQAFDSWSQRKFRFLRPDGTVKVWTAPEVLDTEELGYRYETTAAPTFNAVPQAPAGADIAPFGLEEADFTPVAAASDVHLAGRKTVEIAGADGLDGADLVGPDQSWNLRFDGIRSARPAVTSYALYLDLDDGGEPADEHLAGSLTLFGVFESSLEVNGDLGSDRLFDVTDLVRRLPGFDPLAARLTLVPAHDDRDLEAVDLRIERISLEVG